MHCRLCPKSGEGRNSWVRFIDLIGRRYRVEALARDSGVTWAELHRLRQRDSLPVLCEIEALLLANLHRVVPGSLLGKALHYLSGQWGKLTRYAEDVRYPIDNNPCENAIRPFVVGRQQLAIQ